MAVRNLQTNCLKNLQIILKFNIEKVFLQKLIKNTKFSFESLAFFCYVVTGVSI